MKAKTWISLLFAIVFSGSTWAAKKPNSFLPETGVASKIQAVENRPAGLLSQATHNKLQRVHGYMKNKQYQNALALLKKLETSAAKRPTELAQIYQTMGFVNIENDKLAAALEYLEKSLALKALPKGPTLSTLYTVAQIQLTEGKIDKGIASLKEWFALSQEPGASAYALMANAYAQKKQKKEAFANIVKALSLPGEPAKGWLQLGVALAYELNKYTQAAKYLKALTLRFPGDEKNWKQLAGVYIHLDNPREALATMELAQKAGFLDKESEILNLTSLYLGRGIPYWAAVTLEKGLEKKILKPSQKIMYLLGQSYLQAEEPAKALEPLQAAAKLSKDGKVYLLLGQIFLEKEDWLKASESFSLAIKKGGLKDNNLGAAHLGLGMAYMDLKKIDLAQKAFEKALTVESTKKSAEQWLLSLK